MIESFNSFVPVTDKHKVSVFLGQRFIGNAVVKEVFRESGSYKVLASANWIWPSRNPSDSENLGYLLEQCILPDIENNMTGEVVFKGRNVSWRVRAE